MPMKPSSFIALTSKAAALMLALSGGACADTLFAFSPFPYDMTAEAVERTYDIANRYGTVYAIQLDNGIPWKEALEGKPWPPEVQQQWDEFKSHRPSGRKMVIQVAPLADDRHSRAGAAKGSSVPLSLWFAGFDSDAMKTAYLNYIKRIVAFFQPDYLNIGQEAGELGFHDPAAWEQFGALFHHVRKALKQSSPNLPVGISFNLQMLMMDPKYASRCESVIQDSDFIGISFYPYVSPAYERYGFAPLPPAPEMWRKPLDWLGKFATKPIALFETGYSSTDITLIDSNITLHGNPDYQSQYLRDLASIARRDNYLFVIWFVSIDYDKLFTHIKVNDDYYKIWQHVGFFDPELRPKPAWKVWQGIVGNLADPHLPSSSPPTASAKPALAATANGAIKIGFDQAGDLFSSDANNRFELDPQAYNGASAMRWSFEYAPGRWQWGAKTLTHPPSALQDTVVFSVRSDREGPIMVQLEEDGGETFYAIVPTGLQWQTVRLAASEFKADPAKARDGRLEPGRIKQILLADPAASAEDHPAANGSRSIWFANWEFHAH